MIIGIYWSPDSEEPISIVNAWQGQQGVVALHWHLSNSSSSDILKDPSSYKRNIQVRTPAIKNKTNQYAYKKNCASGPQSTLPFPWVVQGPYVPTQNKK